jgi:hypothetical protein
MKIKYTYILTIVTIILYYSVDGRNPAPPWMIETQAKSWDKSPINWCRISQPSTDITINIAISLWQFNIAIENGHRK